VPPYITYKMEEKDKHDYDVLRYRTRERKKLALLDQ
jgi:hypothetical protein